MMPNLDVTKQPGETPEVYMLRLGQMSQEIMAGRIKAQRSGLDAIHHELAKMSCRIEAIQQELLAANPELLLMVFREGLGGDHRGLVLSHPAVPELVRQK